MSLRFALLGMLAYEPGSGYDLTKRFQGGLGRFAWQAPHTRIYPELAKLAEEGLIEVAEHGPRRRSIYRVTERGRAALQAWMEAPPDALEVRSEPVLRMFLLSALEPASAHEILRQQIAYAERKLGEIRAALDDAMRASSEDGRPPFGRLAAEFGCRQLEALREWATWALGQLEDAEITPQDCETVASGD
jgi:DNA-binding PadR family transcriptional regulator